MSDLITKDLDKNIRGIIFPSLKTNGFQKMKGKTAWGWHDECIWVFNIKAVGYSHSMVTNWPSASLTVNLGIYYTYLPHKSECKKDENGLLCPKEYQCNRRAELTCSYDQLKYTEHVKCNSSEKKRRDIWWVQPDGSNIIEVVNDINIRYLDYAVKWFMEKSDKELTLLEAGRLNGFHIEQIDR